MKILNGVAHIFYAINTHCIVCGDVMTDDFPDAGRHRECFDMLDDDSKNFINNNLKMIRIYLQALQTLSLELKLVKSVAK